MELLSDILGTFHDGTIEGIEGDSSRLVLKISCTYLAEVEKEGNNDFLLTLSDVRVFEFQFWNKRVVEDFELIAALYPGIGYSEIENGVIRVYCHTYEEMENEQGGELRIIAKFEELHTEDLKPLSPEELFELSNKYWGKFR